MSVFDYYNPDRKDYSRMLWEQRQASFDKIHAKQDRDKMKEEIIAEVMKRIQIDYKTNATQAAKELQAAINGIFQGH